MGRKARHKRERREFGQWHSEGFTPAQAEVIEVVARSVFGRVDPNEDGSQMPLAFFSDGKGPMMVMERDGRVVAVREGNDGQATGN